MFSEARILIVLSIVVMALITACGPQAAQPATQPTAKEHQEHQEHAEEKHQHDEAVEFTAVDLADGQKLQVVATTNIVGDLVGNVGGDLIDLTTMLPIGVDPHTFTPTPQDAATVAETDVVFINGLHLEEFLEELIENAGGEATVVPLSTNVETREFEEMEGHEHGDEEGEHHDKDEGEHAKEGEHHDEEHAHEGADPHIWMTPANAIIMVHNIEHALERTGPGQCRNL